MTRFGKDVVTASAVAIATYFTAHALIPQVERATERGESSVRYFRDCGEVRTAGDAPIYQGEPGYRAGLDHDGDGIACEPSSGP